MKTLAIAGLLLMTATSHAATPVPPDVEKRAHEVRAPHGAVRQDEYYWLRDDSREDKAMLASLEAENAYVDQVMAPLKPLEDALYDEFVGRIKQDDASVPFRDRGWWYYSRYETGKDYPVYARRKDAGGLGAVEIMRLNEAGDFAAEQVRLDVNAMAEGKDYFSVGVYEVSPDNRILAWAEDDVGRRQYTIRFRDLETGEVFPESIPGLSADMVWADDSRTLFYVENDPATLLSVRVKKHVLGTPVADDVLVYEEHDDSFYMGLDRTRDDRFICIGVESTVSSELRCTPAADPGEFTVLAPRERDVEYDADHYDGRWVILTNAPDAAGNKAPNYRIVTAPTGATSREQWEEWIGHRDDVLLEGFELFEGFTAIVERSNALERIRLLGPDGGDEYVAADEPAYSMGLSVNAEPGTQWLRYGYTSMTTPGTTFELNVATGERRLLKQQPVIGYDPSKYATERTWATARDGTRIPVSLVYRKGFTKDGTAALLQYAYGSYGMSMDPGYSLTTTSLLDRGMVYAIAHVRGGQEKGRRWYDDGKLQNKINPFTDFIDVTAHLVAEGWAATDR
ncbi:MAG: S9 family peptidase, partial [Gammaproteobacteria bacterium]|nr:S9 family peptidase [Gammaproteobacteria bacterium]